MLPITDIFGNIANPFIGEVAEWTNAADSKSVVALVLPGVRIPLSPLIAL